MVKRISKSKFAVNTMPRIEVYANGCITRRYDCRIVDMSHLENSRRGEVRTFSRASARRLREWLVRYSVPNACAFGVTLTLPGNDKLKHAAEQTQTLKKPPTQSANGKRIQVPGFDDCLHRFGVAFRRRFPHSCYTWRAELQRRGAPHAHLVVWMSSEDYDPSAPFEVPADSPRRSWLLHWLLFQEFAHLWAHAAWPLLSCSPQECYEWMCELSCGVGLDVVQCSDTARYYRYISDHMTKHKASQLGYIGRQWGKVGGRLFVREQPVCVPLPTGEVVDGFRHYPKPVAMFRRLLARLRCYNRIKAACVFGCRHQRPSTRHAVAAVTPVSRSAVLLLLELCGLTPSIKSPKKGPGVGGPQEQVDIPFDDRLFALLRTQDWGNGFVGVRTDFAAARSTEVKTAARRQAGTLS